MMVDKEDVFELAKEQASYGSDYRKNVVEYDAEFTPQQCLELCRLRKEFYTSKGILFRSCEPRILALLLEDIDMQIRDLEYTLALEAVNTDPVVNPDQN